MLSIEEKVEDSFKKIIDDLGIKRYTKSEQINQTISQALKEFDSKSGGKRRKFSRYPNHVG